MANPEHVEIVKQGKEAIAAWRKAHPDERLDLAEADLSGVYLREANLRGANLREANLVGADLIQASLEGTDLGEAELQSANLQRAYLSRANLQNADLSRANLGETNLIGANLQRAYLMDTCLVGADLSRANLGETNLQRANLQRANLREANLREANLAQGNLIEATLDNANISDACLWETQRAGWSIKGIICDTVYWDRDYWDSVRKEPTSYAPGEFERLYADTFKIKLRYEGGIDLNEIATLPALIKQIEERYPGCTLRFQSIQDDAGGASVIIAIDKLGEYDFKTIEMTAQQTQHQLSLAIKENEQLRVKLDFVMEEVIPAIVRQPTTEINIRNLIATDRSRKRTYMSEQHIHGGHFQGCSFGDHNSLTNYFGVVDTLDTVEEDIKKKLKEAREAIEGADLSDADKADVVDELNKLTAELEKPEKDEGRVQRYWNRIKEVAPTVASILASAASLGKILGLA